MMELLAETQTAYALVIAALTGIIFFFIGKASGGIFEKKRLLNEQKEFEKKLSLSEAAKNEIRRQVDELKKQNEKYAYFVVRIPETVKHLNSSLTFDETISSVIRVTKDLVNTDCIEAYIYNEAAGVLTLEAAYGSKRKESVSFAVGEGLIGKAAKLKMMLAQENNGTGTKALDGQMMHAAPMISRGRLIGILGLGRLLNPTGDEKRLIAMVTDLAAISLQNCERLSTAQDEANTDALTKLYNRKYFAERSLDEVQKALSYSFPISIFMFDIDHFKKYNDQNGHAEGDYLLRELSSLLKKHTRSRDVVARYGGEEFIVMLPNTDKHGAAQYAEKIRKMIEATPFKHREKQPLGFVSVSGGVATFPADGDTIEAVTKLADAALYKSKESGRNRVTLYEHPRFNTSEETI
ncbi:MAG: sensor domain-containing diguanylate cyclase [Nitrospirae bacterium]|nr:sensor domain-containing diguanylate cyclase [Nitrospirota bacterium]